jgi:hypothetical protein
MAQFEAGFFGGVVTYGVEVERVHLDTKGGDVLLLEFTSQVALDEGGLLRFSVLVMKSR